MFVHDIPFHVVLTILVGYITEVSQQLRDSIFPRIPLLSRRNFHFGMQLIGKSTLMPLESITWRLAGWVVAKSTMQEYIKVYLLTRRAYFVAYERNGNAKQLNRLRNSILFPYSECLKNTLCSWFISTCEYWYIFLGSALHQCTIYCTIQF